MNVTTRRRTHRRLRFAVTTIVIVYLTVPQAHADGPAVVAQADSVFQQHVRPILQEKCSRCHGPEQQKADLMLSSPAGILKGGESGEILTPGDPAESLLFEMIEKGAMPPTKKDRLSKEQVELIRRWIEDGAKLGAAETKRQLTQDDIIPILLLRCTACHGAQKQEAGLDLRTVTGMLRGGTSGPALVPGNAEQSLILKKITSGEMPPRRRLVEASVKPMEVNELGRLEQWIADGASVVTARPESADPNARAALTDRFWSFETPLAADVPEVQHRDRVRTPVDSFMLRKLEDRGLSLSPEADALILMRRAYFDLLGMPPTREEVLAFERESARDLETAYQRLIDRLLASSRYGERWGRFWLDVAGYSDSEGVQHDDTVRANAWRYRDYVIRAFNTDKPYDRFLLEQIAGDELADYRNPDAITPEIYDNLVATGFLRMAPDGTWANITNFVPDRLDVIGDEMEILSSAVMGLTFKCAKCHSHKFDPITQRDYYSLLATFKGAYDEHNWLKPLKTTRFSSGPFATRWLPFVTTEERRAWEANEKRIGDAIAAVNKELKQRQDELSEADFEKAEQAAKSRVDALEAQRKPEPMIRALWDRGEPSPTFLLRRGNYLTPGKLVQPGVPAFLTRSAKFEVQAPSDKTTGRRLALAKWLVQPTHPLTARVMVNRVWKHHFGSGIVRTLDNFGKTGARPTHPELLDWLAVEFVRSGWSVKSLHRLIMTSSTYRQSSAVTAVHEERDPDNQLLSRMPMRRLDAESIRDTLLFVSGKLSDRPFGPPDPVEMREDGLVTSVETSAGWRRSIFVLQRRTQVPTILGNFDLPQMGPNCVERTQSTVAPQALHLMNNAMIHRLSLELANRAVSEAGADHSRQIEWIYLTTLSRRPATAERQLAVDSLGRLQEVWQAKLNTESSQDDSQSIREQAARHALANLCHAMMNSASLLYVD